METETVTPFAGTPGYPALTTGPLLLLLIVVAATIGWWWWRRRGGGLAGTAHGLQIQLLATRALGPRSHLAVIEVAGCRSLIATTAQGVHFLRDLPREATPAPAEAAPAGDAFSRHLSGKGTDTP